MAIHLHLRKINAFKNFTSNYAGFRRAMSEWGSNGLTVFRIRGPNGITKNPPTLFVFGHLTVGSLKMVNTFAIERIINNILVC